MRLLLLIATSLAFCHQALAMADDQLVGLWQTANGDSTVRIELCGMDTYCGTVAWLREPLNSDGMPKTDELNPDPDLRGRAILGLTILRDIRAESAPGRWLGHVYNPEDGKTYDLQIAAENNRLKITGCLFSILCKSERWERVPEQETH